MKKNIFFVIFLIAFNISFSQKSDKKYYDLRNNPKSIIGKELITKFNYLPESEGVVTFEFEEQKFEGVINKMIFSSIYHDKVSKNNFVRKYVEDYSDMQFTMMGEVMEEKGESKLTGLEVNFFKKNGKYIVKDLEKYSDSIKKELIEELNTFNSYKFKQYNYLKKVKINEVIVLDKKKITSMLGNFGEIENAEGNLKIIDVIKKNEDEIAILKVSFKADFIDSSAEEGPLKMIFNFRGTIERSLNLDIDLKSELVGSLSVEGSFLIEEGVYGKMTMKTNGKFSGTSKVLNAK